MGWEKRGTYGDGVLDPPTRPELFTPDLYPAGPPLEPAAAPGPTGPELLGDLAAISGEHRADGPMHWHVDDRLMAKVPDVPVRAGVAALAATIGEPLLEWLVADDCPIESIGWGDPGGDRIAGIAQPADRPTHRVLNQRYRYEHPFLATGSLLHQLCWNPDADNHPQEVLLHALLAVAHAQLIELLPSLVGSTELARRQQSLVLSLLCSRSAGRDGVRIIAPNGEGTIPGGAPAMQTPDLWSIPFATGEDPVAAPPQLDLVLGPWLSPGSLPLASTFDRRLVAAVDAEALDGWLTPGLARGTLAALSVETDAGRLPDVGIAAGHGAIPQSEQDRATAEASLRETLDEESW